MALGRDRRGTPVDALVLGLGNPGERYRRTRHNVGADTVDRLSERHGARLKSGRQQARMAETTIEGARVILAVPVTFYNEVGLAGRALANRGGITEPERIIVVHDELDLPPAAVRVKAGGGLAGNKGLASLRSHLHTDGFTRIRIGVGKPPDPTAGAHHVLHRPRGAERRDLDQAIASAADAAEVIVAEGLEAAMGRFNRRS